MSGRKQHFIPQCLLRGFEAAKSGKLPQVYVVRPSRPPYKTAVQDVAAQRHFYSKLSNSGVKTLDDVITEYENHLGARLATLRAAMPGEAIDGVFAAEVVAHLTVRGDAVRTTFDKGMRELLAGARTIFSSSSSLRAYIGVDSNEPESMVVQIADEALKGLTQHFPQPGMLDTVRRMLLFRMRESFSEFFESSSGKLGEQFDTILAGLPKTVQTGHALALGESLTPAARMQTLSQMLWTCVDAVADEHFILPDCVAISQTGGSTSFVPYLLQSNDDASVVVMPLTAQRLLVGVASGAEAFSVDGINVRSAECSFEFFVSSTCGEDVKLLAARIASASIPTVLEAVEDALADLTRQTRKEATARPTSAAVTGTDAATTSHQYVVSFVNCANEDEAHQIAAVVKAIIDALSPHLPMYGIESIVFTSTYEQTLSELDRGFQCETQLVSKAQPGELGGAMAIVVLRDGKPKTSIVVRDGFGYALLDSKNTEQQTFAVYIVASMAAHAAYTQMLEQAFPGLLTRPYGGTWEHIFLRSLDSVASEYFAARMTAEIDPGLSEGYHELFRSAVKAAFETIPADRQAYHHHGNLDTFLQAALVGVGLVLSRAAILLGHLDALDQPLEDVRLTKELLATHGLMSWVQVLQMDLQRLFEDRGHWASFDAFLSLMVHVERLLWNFGVLAWCDGEGNVRVVIPFNSDFEALGIDDADDPAPG